MAVNTASLFLMTTPTNNILISVFKLFDPPVKRSKRKERPITERMRGMSDMYTETEMSATDGETDPGAGVSDTEGDMAPRERYANTCVATSMITVLFDRGNSLLGRRRRKIRPAIGIPSVPVITEEPTNHSNDVKANENHNTSAAPMTAASFNVSASPKKERAGQNNAVGNVVGAKNRKMAPKSSDKPNSAATSTAQKNDSGVKSNEPSNAAAQKNK